MKQKFQAGDVLRIRPEYYSCTNNEIGAVVCSLGYGIDIKIGNIYVVKTIISPPQSVTFTLVLKSDICNHPGWIEHWFEKVEKLTKLEKLIYDL